MRSDLTNLTKKLTRIKTNVHKTTKGYTTPTVSPLSQISPLQLISYAYLQSFPLTIYWLKICFYRRLYRPQCRLKPLQGIPV